MCLWRLLLKCTFSFYVTAVGWKSYRPLTLFKYDENYPSTGFFPWYLNHILLLSIWYYIIWLPPLQWRNNNTNFSFSRFPFLVTDISIPQSTNFNPWGPCAPHSSSLSTHRFVTNSGQLFLNISGIHTIHIAIDGFQSLTCCLPVPKNPPYPYCFAICPHSNS